MAGEGFIDPLGQVAQILGVSRTSQVRPQNEVSKPEVPRRTEAGGPAAAVHLSHSGPALAQMAERLRAVGFVHDPGNTAPHEPGHENKTGGSQEAVELSTGSAEPIDAKDSPTGDSSGGSADSGSPGKQELSEAEEKEVRKLKERDREVRTHEMAHKAAAGELAPSGPHYEYEQGPDGRDYAVGGHVPIRIPASDDPKETLQNAEKARRAALAPADPSPQDRAVAQEASQMAAAARAQIAEQEASAEKPAADKETLEATPSDPVEVDLVGSGGESAQAAATSDDGQDSEEEREVEATAHPEYILGGAFALHLEQTGRS